MSLLRLRIVRKPLQIELFPSLSSSLQQIWKDWRKLLVKFSTSVKPGQCGLIRTHWKTLCDKYLFQSEISRGKTWNAMWFRENNNDAIKQACKWHSKCYQCCSWCKLNLIHSIYPKAEILLKGYQCFLQWNLSLINANQHSQHLKKHKNRNSETTRWKITEDSRLCKAQKISHGMMDHFINEIIDRCNSTTLQLFFPKVRLIILTDQFKQMSAKTHSKLRSKSKWGNK